MYMCMRMPYASDYHIDNTVKLLLMAFVSQQIAFKNPKLSLTVTNTFTLTYCSYIIPVEDSSDLQKLAGLVGLA